MPDAFKIRQLNDDCRTQIDMKAKTLITSGILALGLEIIAKATYKMVSFDDFDEDTPEHDFGTFTIDGQKFFWKIDYYNLTMDGGSPDPSDPEVTQRVLTLMLAEEY